MDPLSHLKKEMSAFQVLDEVSYCALRPKTGEFFSMCSFKESCTLGQGMVKAVVRKKRSYGGPFFNGLTKKNGGKERHWKIKGE